MPPPRLCASFAAPMRTFSIPYRPQCLFLSPKASTPRPSLQARPFTTSSPLLNWLAPRSGETRKSRKGRPRVPTGGSIRGTTVVWGDYGLRLLDHDRRISAAHFRIAEETIKKRLRGERYRLFHRVAANIGVYTSGNESRMGGGKGSFDHWAARVAVSRIVFELKGEVHEQVVKDAFRLAGNKLPGQWEFVKKGDPPVMGITKVGAVGGLSREDLLKPRRKIVPSASNTADRLGETQTAIRAQSQEARADKPV
ncbi:ribosomal protein L16 [Aulographum hederae CBS 113979]|uniref:Ribosomal protein L16 n=1 Tax=Aulographum hederae CBS 113979 TaxID=1176131 RepID=A0A6G1HEA1_9PEZI|nr:ribosomal protein L16 [Aulographum hederae CBS 113979]